MKTSENAFPLLPPGYSQFIIGFLLTDCGCNLLKEKQNSIVCKIYYSVEFEFFNANYMPIITILNSVFFCPALKIPLQIMCGNILYISKNKIHKKVLYEEPISFGKNISLMKHMS